MLFRSESPEEAAGQEERSTSATGGNATDAYDAGEGSEAGHGSAANGRDDGNPGFSNVGDHLHQGIESDSHGIRVGPSTDTNMDMIESAGQVLS